MKTGSRISIATLASLAATSITVAIVAQSGTVNPANPTLLDDYGSVTNVRALTSAPQAIPLNASSSVIAPTVQLSRTSLIFFGYPHRCKQAYPESVMVTNLGPSTLNISNITVAPYTLFSGTSTCGATLAAGNSCTITVTWKYFSGIGKLSISDNGANSPQTVGLEGMVQCLS